MVSLKEKHLRPGTLGRAGQWVSPSLELSSPRLSGPQSSHQLLPSRLQVSATFAQVCLPPFSNLQPRHLGLTQGWS